MRAIKFRAWDKERNLLIPAGNVFLAMTFEGEISELSESGASLTWGGTFHSENKYELMQFTGLHDKNGVEIYEGDTVKFGITHGLATVKGESEVYFTDGCFRLKSHRPVADYVQNGMIEVIGNIYEGVRDE